MRSAEEEIVPQRFTIEKKVRSNGIDGERGIEDGRTPKCERYITTASGTIVKASICSAVPLSAIVIHCIDDPISLQLTFACVCHRARARAGAASIASTRKFNFNIRLHCMRTRARRAQLRCSLCDRESAFLSHPSVEWTSAVHLHE
jgi:hypothetical protein